MSGDEARVWPARRVYLDAADGWTPVGRDPRGSLHTAGVAFDVDLRRPARSEVTVHADRGNDEFAFLRGLLAGGRAHAPHPLSPSVQHPTLEAMTYSIRGDGRVRVRNPRFPRPAARRLGESRASAAGRRRVATAMRRRARRAGIPEHVTRPWTTFIPRAHLHIRGDRLTFRARGER